jgi:isoleucyl-tRNA synthetase
MRFSAEILQRVAEAYRKVRNTCRYLLSNLYDYDPARNAVAEADLDDLDRFALNRHREIVARVREAYDAYEFHVVYHTLTQYAAADLSAFYLDVLKDRLYCDRPDGARRRSAQTILYRLANDIATLLAPVLTFTTDEVFRAIPGRKGSVHEALFPAVEKADADTLARWAPLLTARAVVTKAVEDARNQKVCASSLEAHVTLRGNADALAPLRAYEARSEVFPGNLASLFIVSKVTLQELPGSGSAGPTGAGLVADIARAPGTKCERCWTYSEQVGRLSHPGVCERCDAVLRSLS